MSFWETQLVTKNVSKRTPILIGIFFFASIFLLLFLISLCFMFRRRRRSSLPPPSSQYSACRKPLKLHLRDCTPNTSKEICASNSKSEIEISSIRNHTCKEICVSNSKSEIEISSIIRKCDEEIFKMGWGYSYTLQEIQIACNGFRDENVIGEGGFGIVYRGIFNDGTVVAIKNLFNNRGQAEKEFRGEVEAIGLVRHKNLVRLLGYCVEEDYRILVYEYVDNGNLDQWLHGDVGDVSPLSWDIRMNIILGTAKGLAYIHEGLEPKVVHRDVKSSNILLDKQWNPKVSDFGLAKLICSQRSYVTTRVMGTFGYVAPEYASTGMLNERSDAYSFGVLIMEVISGRIPVDYSRPPGEVNLVEWLKNMIGERRFEEIIDPKIFEKPSSKMLKRALLVSLRCVDPEALKRPKMGNVVHMLEMEGLLLNEDWKLGQDAYDKPFIPKK